MSLSRASSWARRSDPPLSPGGDPLPASQPPSPPPLEIPNVDFTSSPRASPRATHRQGSFANKPLSRQSSFAAVGKKPGYQWRPGTARGGEQWLEDNRGVDASVLVNFGLNVDGLTEVLQELIGSTLANTKAIERQKVETGKIYKIIDEQRQEMVDMTQHMNELEVELQGLKKEVQVVHENREALARFNTFKESQEVQMIDLQQECRRLDGAKLDHKSPKLESDARKYALDTVKSFFNIRNKETKDWIEKKVTALQKSFADELQEIAQTASAETQAVSSKVSALVETAKMDLDGKVRTHNVCLENCSAKFDAVFEKLEATEADVDMQVGNLAAELDRAFRETRLMYTTFSLNYPDLKKAVPAGWESVHVSLEDLDAQRRGITLRIARLDQRLQGWRALHDPATHVLSECANQSKWEVADAHRARQLDQLKEKETDAPVALPPRPEDPNTFVSDAASTMLLCGKVFTDFRSATDKLVSSIVGQTAEDLKEDLSQEGQRIAKDLKTKLTTQKCLDLIAEHVGDAFFEEQKANALKFEILEEDKVGYERLNDMLRSKADTSMLQGKADRSVMLEMIEYINSKIGVETSDDAVKRHIRTLKSKVDELASRKLDQDNPDLLLLFEAMKGGAGGANAAGAGANAATPVVKSMFTAPPPAAAVSRAGQLPPSTPGMAPRPGTPGRAFTPATPVAGSAEKADTCMSCFTKAGPDSSLEDVLTRRERDKQVAQDAIHARQMASGKTIKVQSYKRAKEVGGSFNIDNYIDNLSKPIHPTPPPMRVPTARERVDG